ncbi:MAG: 50S ribosomal protein L11 methyltransferase [Hyphomicrobiales bacterium]|nr:50S ribosomal protein L11 methyltransferase [Hyphomicrobiales bacterium]
MGLARAAEALMDIAPMAIGCYEIQTATPSWRPGQWVLEFCLEDDFGLELARVFIAENLGAARAATAELTEVPAADWIARSLEGLAPVRAGRFWLHGQHDRAQRRPHDVALEIEAALAFGTGHHGTTRGCLLMFDGVLKRRRPRHVLDVGTGTGVLAIAAAKVLRRRVIAGDIDPVATRVAQANVALNGVRPFVRALAAAGVDHPALRGGAPYDLIFANILAAPLRGMAADLALACARHGEIIVSGLLAGDVAGVLSAFRWQGFHLARRLDVEGWATLLLRRIDSSAKIR